MSNQSADETMAGAKMRVGVLAAAFLLLTVSLYALTPGALGMGKGQAVTLERKVSKAMRVPARWTGSTGPCRIGRESKRSLRATLFTVNTIRKFAGLNPVKFDPKKNRQALAAALIMYASFNLSHNPRPSWDCYTKAGAEGAGHSNLAWGASGPRAILLYADDAGVPSLGHRQWLLNPGAVKMGSGSTGYTNGLYVDWSYEWRARRAVVTWPSKGYFPDSWMPPTWSATFKEWDFGNRLPEVSAKVGGRKVRVKSVRRLARYGAGSAFAWRLEVPNRYKKKDRPVRIRISSPSGHKTLTRYTVRPT